MKSESPKKYLVENPDVIQDLGERLYEKITTSVVREWQEAFRQLTREDCIAYIHNLTINQTYDQNAGPDYFREKSVIYDGLAQSLPTVRFVETWEALNNMGVNFDEDISYLSYVDYLGYVGEKAFGIQVKPTTAKSNFGNYSVSERMKGSFAEFTELYTGRVFIVFSLDGEIGNPEIIDEIAGEIARLGAA